MEHLLPAGHNSMHSRVLGPGGWGAEGGSGEGAHDLQDAVKPGAAKSALFPVTSFLDGLALSPPPRGSIASRSGPGQLVSFFRRRLLHSPRCEAAKPIGVYGRNLPNHPHYRPASHQERGDHWESQHHSPPNPGSWNKSQIPTGCSASSGELSHRCVPQYSFSSFLFESQGYRRLSPMGTGTPRVSSLAPFSNLSLSLQPEYRAPLGNAAAPMSKLTSAD